MNFRLRDKSKAKIRNYQINFAASLQIPSPNRKITDRNRPSNSPPPRSLRNNRHTVPYRPVPFSLVPSSLVPFLLSCLVLSCPVLSCPVSPVLSRSLLSRSLLSRPISIPSYFYPVLFLSRPLLPAASPRPGPNSFRVRSDHDTHPDSSRACPTFITPRPFPRSRTTCRHRPLSEPHPRGPLRTRTKPDPPRHAPRQVHRPHTTKYPRRKFRQGYPLYPKIVTWQRIHIKNVTAPVLPRGVRPGAVTNMLRTTKMRHHFHH